MTRPITVTVVDAGDRVEAVMDDGNALQTRVITLTTVATHTVLMSQNPDASDPRDSGILEPGWAIGTVRLEDGGDTLVVGSFDQVAAKEAVATGILTGTTGGIDAGDFASTTVDVSPTMLRSYLEANPAALDEQPHVQLTRIQSEASLPGAGWLAVAVGAAGTLGLAALAYWQRSRRRP
jgi:hypothetical protein